MTELLKYSRKVILSTHKKTPWTIKNLMNINFIRCFITNSKEEKKCKEISLISYMTLVKLCHLSRPPFPYL